MNRPTAVFLAILCFCAGANSQTSPPLKKSLLFPGATAAVLPSNSISHLAVQGSTLWAGTGVGLARSDDGGRSWVSYAANDQFARPSIFSLAVKADTVWASTGYSKDVSGSSVQTGSGSTYSVDNGTTWHGVPQPLDPLGDSVVIYGANRVHFLPIVVPEQNVTFSSSISGNAVWIASWSSGLRKSTDLGTTWQRIVLPSHDLSSVAPTDTVSYTMDPRNDNNFLAFAVATVGDDTVWAGTAGGVNLSTDGGQSWAHFSATNESAHIGSDWVISIAVQPIGPHGRVWTTNWPAEGANQVYAVSYSDDNGLSWSNQLVGEKAYGFAFKDSIVYVATGDGIYRTSNGGSTWLKSGSIVDPVSGNQLTSTTFYSVAVIGDTVYGASDDGLARTIDNATHPFGASWQVLRSFVPSQSPSKVYAYPNPFAPVLQSVRIHYTTGSAPGSVSIEVFDFGMNRVRTVVKDVTRSGENDEIWDGKDEWARTVVNGVYFYRVTINGGTPAWGKILVLQ